MEQNIPLFILLLGGIVILTILIRPGLKRIGMPPVVGFLVLGILIRLADSHWGFISQGFSDIFGFLATVGIILLLFRVGLESKLAQLMGQLRLASVIWVGDVLVSGALGYVASYFLLGLGLIPSLFIAIALTATSVAVSVGVWQETKALKSPIGQLLVDVAEMDDISGIILMAVLFAVIPILRGGQETALVPVLGRTVGLLLAKLVGFGAFCFFLSRYVEPRITSFLRKFEPVPGQTLALAGGGFIIAALAGLIGFSVAIGAFFAGLVFSRDPRTVRLDTPFTILYELFAPFFFINIGLSIDPGAMTMALGLAGALVAMAFLGKVVGVGGPAARPAGWTGGLLLGFSMVPRAEITMVIMHRGLQLGTWAVPTDVFSAMVIVTLVTAIVPPIIVRALLKRWPQTNSRPS